VGGECEGQDCSGGPAKQQRDWMREQCSGPAEIASYVAVAVELGVCLGGECAGEKDSEEKEDDSANLAGERGRRRLIVPVPVRAS
jgi:hypothetical protein